MHSIAIGGKNALLSKLDVLLDDFPGPTGLN
jgi:hypothetical protein